ncbi:MerR family transcriptional regulator [Salininema proteolyticum]|uniref:MerR family transcriptional regulator n=1 Tax=Salininema proteolyticum TaxID=1607685 RepID=A0ABV8TUW9_9ACTN
MAVPTPEAMPQETWPIGEVAEMAGVSTRTLRHYDAKGLLKPSHVRHGGIRCYGPGELLRLQEILLLRRLGLGLEAIAAVLAGETDRVEALKGHRRALRSERDRLGRLLDTVDSTIHQIEGNEPMKPRTWFKDLDPQTAAAYEAEARERWGDESVDRSAEAFASLSEEEKALHGEKWHGLVARAVEMMRSGEPADSEAFQEIVAEHYEWLKPMWAGRVQKSAYIGLGRMYADDERFAAQFDRAAEGLAEYFARGMAVFAGKHLED